MSRIKINEIFTLPNILTYFRLLCVPIFVILFFSSLKYNIYWALIVFIIAEVTDIVDGKIARKYNLITDIGKVMDPLADKLLQIAALICLCINGNIHLTFVILLGVKELILITGGIIFFAYNAVGQANFWGKRANEILGYSMILVFFHEVIIKYIKFPVDWVLIGAGLLVAYIALVDYSIKSYKQLKNRDLTKKENIDIDFK